MPTDTESLDLTEASSSAKKRDAKKTKKRKELVPREKSFEVKYSAPSGKNLSTTITSKIMDGSARTMVGRICAEMSGGQTWGNLPPATQARVYALAVMHQQLDDPPSWVMEWAQQDDLLLESIYQNLSGHEIFFFGGRTEQGDGDSGESTVCVTEVGA
jgi:hypothetical protein